LNLDDVRLRLDERRRRVTSADLRDVCQAFLDGGATALEELEAAVLLRAALNVIGARRGATPAPSTRTPSPPPSAAAGLGAPTHAKTPPPPAAEGGTP
jgi:hypothetical protein